GYVRQNPPPYEVGIKQKVGESADHIQAILNRLPLRFNRQLRDGKYAWRCTNKSLWTYCAREIGIGAYSKHLPRKLLNLGSKQLQILFDALIDDDSKLDPDRVGSGEYTSFSPQLRDDFQELTLRLGYRAQIREHIVRFVRRRWSIP